MGVYTINGKGEVASTSTVIGNRVKGIIIRDETGFVASASALMLRVISALIYPKELQCYELTQKALLQLDADRLSPKVLGLKNKLMGL